MTAVTRPGSWQLDQRVDELNFVNVNPREVLERLSTYANIVVNWQELTVLGASFDRPVTYNRRNVKLGEAIEKVLALASGNHYAIAVGSLGNAVVVSTPQGLKDSAMMYERTAGQVAGSPYKANKNMMAEKLDRIDMNDMELSQVLEFSGHLTDRKVQIDWDALKQHDITEDLVITVNLRKPAFALFLRLVLDQAGTGDVLLDAKVKEGSIIITPLSDQPAGKQTGK
jgi:hypothetical protein